MLFKSRNINFYMVLGKKPVGKVWLNGKFMPPEKALDSVFIHTTHYGDGVFEGIRFYETDKGSAVFRLQEHVERFFKSAKSIYMQIPFSRSEIGFAILETVISSGLKSGYIRPIAYFGEGLGVDPKDCGVNVAIGVLDWPPYLGDKPTHVKIPSIMRIHPRAEDVEAKICGQYANSSRATREVRLEGYNEALFLDYENNIAEGSGQNVFFVKDENLFTPQKGTILPGITRDSLIRIARDEGIGIIEKKISLEDALNSDEAFFCGTATEVSPIASITDKEKVEWKMTHKFGPITEKLKTLYSNIVRGKNQKYGDWLYYLPSKQNTVINV